MRVVDAAGRVSYEDDASGRVVARLPDGAYAVDTPWVRVVAASPQPYWLHEPSGNTRWRRPWVRCLAGDDVYFEDLASGSAAWEPPEEGAVLASSWVRCDADAGTYFYEPATGNSSWGAPWE